jgi:hypothetical protein
LKKFADDTAKMIEEHLDLAKETAPVNRMVIVSDVTVGPHNDRFHSTAGPTK